MTQISNVALVLEGGGFRGIYTAGVLDAMHEEQLFFDYLIGVSAGAAYSVSYVARQHGRNLEVNRYINDKRYCGWHHMLRNGSYFNWDFVYHGMPMTLVPFDYAGYNMSPSRLTVVVSNIETGLPEYHLLKTDKPDEFRDWLTATSSLPIISKPKAINGKLYMDGGMSDSIPIKKAMADGNQRAVVVLTREKGYRKEPLKKSLLLTLCYRKYPKVAQMMMDRADAYNRSLDEVERLEREGTVFVIRPLEKPVVSRLENKPQKLEVEYHMAHGQMKSEMSRLLQWLAQ
jgi:predicted patatin/cPLA2 family phospholipase